MKKNKLKGGYVHGIYVSATTREEYKRNKEQFKEEGIKSSYSLQKQKNITTKLLKIERETRRNQIKKAYELEKGKLEDIGYNLDFFLNSFQKIEEYNQKINRAIKKGTILADTPLLAFPISTDTGKINLNRLKKAMGKTKIPVKKIQEQQTDTFYVNVAEVYGTDIANITRNSLKGKSVKAIYEHFNDDQFLAFLVMYNIENFSEEDRVTYWDDLSRYQNHFLDMVEDLRRN